MACQLPLRHKSPEYNEFSFEAFPDQIFIEEYSRTYGEYSAGIRRTDPAHEPRILRQGPRSVRFLPQTIQGLTPHRADHGWLPAASSGVS